MDIGELVSFNVTDGPDICFHRKVIWSMSGSSLLLPSKEPTYPALIVLSCPALATGGRFMCFTVTVETTGFMLSAPLLSFAVNKNFSVVFSMILEGAVNVVFGIEELLSFE